MQGPLAPCVTLGGALPLPLWNPACPLGGSGAGAGVMTHSQLLRQSLGCSVVLCNREIVQQLGGVSTDRKHQGGPGKRTPCGWGFLLFAPPLSVAASRPTKHLPHCPAGGRS